MHLATYALQFCCYIAGENNVREKIFRKLVRTGVVYFKLLSLQSPGESAGRSSFIYCRFLNSIGYYL